ncbi:hypothetical protein [Aquiflexum sp.]|uniref:hypothetical protein n=1 Tax=Aquiflexum sp. TaxID=1872584 RepID=UPI0035945E8D
MNSSKNKRVSTASTFLKVVAAINGSVLVIFLIPGVMESLGVQEPYSTFWRELPLLLAIYANLTLWISALDIEKFAIIPMWNSVLRFTFTIFCFAKGYGDTVGSFAVQLAIADLVIGIITIVLVQRALNKPFLSILLNR